MSEYRFDRYRNGCRMAEGLVLTKFTSVDDAVAVVAALAQSGEIYVMRQDARIADLEAELDAALNRAREARETAENYLGHCDAACKQLEAVEAERDAAKAGEARAVDGLRRIREELETIAAGKEEEVRNDFSSGESHGWGSAYLHVCRIIGNAATQPAIDWLAQREREAAARELNQLGPLGSSKQEVFMVPWSEIKQRIAALANQQPTACPRSEVRGKERFRA